MESPCGRRLSGIPSLSPNGSFEGTSSDLLARGHANPRYRSAMTRTRSQAGSVGRWFRRQFGAPPAPILMRFGCTSGTRDLDLQLDIACMLHFEAVRTRLAGARPSAWCRSAGPKDV